MTVTLPADLQAFVDEQVALGAAPDADAVLAEAVRVLRQKRDEEKRAWLQAALDDGLAQLDAGKVIRGPINARQMLEEIRQKRGQS
jgi:putative addiction module CopG family antidote